MSKQRQQQHREEAEDKKKSRQLTDLRQENQQLRKKVSRLQKTLGKTLDSMYDCDDDVELESPNFTLEAMKTSCPECKAKGLAEVKLPHGILKVCKSCGHRKLWK
jgi:uncharacterized protein YlxW (UPF0749 family)